MNGVYWTSIRFDSYLIWVWCPEDMILVSLVVAVVLIHLVGVEMISMEVVLSSTSFIQQLIMLLLRLVARMD